MKHIKRYIVPVLVIVAAFLLGHLSGYIVTEQRLGSSELERATEQINKRLGCDRITLDARSTDKYCGEFWDYYFDNQAEHGP